MTTKTAMLTFGDQALSSLTNFALTFFALRSVSLTEFGLFSLAMIGYQLAIGFSRTLVGEPVLIRGGSALLAERSQAHVQSAATGLGLLLGGLFGALMLCVAFVVEPTLGALLFTLGAGMPLLVLQDVWRHIFFAGERPGRALVNDAIWGAGLIVALAVNANAEGTSLQGIVTAWVVAGCVAGMGGWVQGRTPPDLVRGLRWGREYLHISGRFFAEFAVNRGVGQLALVIVAAIAGPAVLGGISGARTVLGPVNVLFLATPLYFIPRGRMIAAEMPMRFGRWINRLAAWLSLVGLIAGVVVMALPKDIGRALVQANWDTVRSFVPAMTILVAGMGVRWGYFIGLRVTEAAKSSLMTQSLTGMIVLAATSVGAIAFGGAGAAYGMAGGYGVGAMLWWRAFQSVYANRGQTLVQD